MQHLLTSEQASRYAGFRAFVQEHVEPFAEAWDREQALPAAVIAQLASAGYLGCSLPERHGGQGWDVVTFGLLNEALGRGSSSLTGVLTVQTMVAKSLLKWGNAAQIERWIPPLAKGEMVGAFALTEPGAGSDLQALVTEFTPAEEGGYRLNGVKRWITCGQIASVYLVFGRVGEQSLCALVPRDAAGLTVEPIRDLMGFRAAGLAELTFRDVAVPAANVVGKPGFALSHIATVGLHYGRISTACSALGLARGCVEESVGWAQQRKIAGKPLGELGMMRSLLAAMGTDVEAAGFLCHNACRAADENLPEAFEKAVMAKYFASRAAVKAAADAVQMQGAAGCQAASAVSRFYRDAKIMEIIEGTTQVHEHLLGGMFLRRARRSSP